LPLAGETPVSMDSEAEETDDAGDFDLAAELLGALDGEESGRFSGGTDGTTEEEGFEQVFAAFKQGVQQELGDGDIEAHYDLGIAYKEMGLLEDAIGEFQIALRGPARKLASLHAMGLCALEMDRVSDAISHLQQALALPEIPNEQQTALRFDLGRAYQQQGDLERALGAFEAVAEVDPDFCSVGERLAELDRSEISDGANALAAEQQEETFESFDDFIEGAEPPTESESYESFEDLISENDDDEFGEAEPPFRQPEPEAEAPEMESTPASEPEVAKLEMESVPELEPEVAEFEMESASEPESEVAEFEMEPVSEPEPEVAELEMESASEPEAEEVETEPAPEPKPAPKKPSRRKKISFV
jgi:tetratricopeptide (TPR) repeat protein